MSGLDEPDVGRLSRRELLTRLGRGAVGAAAASAGAGLGVRPALAAAGPRPAQEAPSGRFGRLFRLRPFAEPTPALTEALLDIGRPGGLLDAGDDLDAGPVALIADAALSNGNRNNPNPAFTAGATFVGQFIDHDLTFDATSRLGSPTAPEATTNVRTPAFDLELVYGSGPAAAPHLYDARDRAKLRVESCGPFEDLPRAADMSAIIGDPRNDQNLLVAGLHAAFLLFHNRCVDLVRSQGTTEPSSVLAQARQLTTWHYQWIVVHEFLPLFIGAALAEEVTTGPSRCYRTSSAFIPVEFQGAAYRFGHSMVRPSYRANMAGHDGQPFFGFIFDPAQAGASDPDDLSGGARAPRRFVGWQTFFDFTDGEVRPNKRIDTRISTPLFHLPLRAIPTGEEPTALPQRTLLRHVTWLLPSGQAVARALGEQALDPDELSELAGYGLGLERSTPLWYYVLKEAELRADGARLGPVGGRIVGEVFLGLLRADPGAYPAARPSWRPSLPRREGPPGDFRIVDFLTFAGVDPASRGQ